MRQDIVQPLDDLRGDLQALARDAEALLKATASLAGDGIQEARQRAEASLQLTVQHLYDRKLPHRTRQLVQQTDRYVREHSWAVIGAAAGLGFLLGVLAARGQR